MSAIDSPSEINRRIGAHLALIARGIDHPLRAFWTPGRAYEFPLADIITGLRINPTLAAAVVDRLGAGRMLELPAPDTRLACIWRPGKLECCDIELTGDVGRVVNQGGVAALIVAFGRDPGLLALLRRAKARMN